MSGLLFAYVDASILSRALLPPLQPQQSFPPFPEDVDFFSTQMLLLHIFAQTWNAPCLQLYRRLTLNI